MPSIIALQIVGIYSTGIYNSLHFITHYISLRKVPSHPSPTPNVILHLIGTEPVRSFCIQCRASHKCQNAALLWQTLTLCTRYLSPILLTCAHKGEVFISLSKSMVRRRIQVGSFISACPSILAHVVFNTTGPINISQLANFLVYSSLLSKTNRLC